jgi:CubicO group peptidase (beta-lactamase class C family)
MKALRSLLCAGLLALSSTAPSWGADLPTADPEGLGFSSERLSRIRPVIQGEIDKGQYPGAVMLVVRNGRIVHFEAVGQLDPATGKPMPTDAIFRLYSMTKPFTSVAIMMLMEEGRLRMTDPVSKYIPALGNLQVSVERRDPYTGATQYVNEPAHREISIQDLLRHTSGMVYAGFTAHAKVKELYAKEGVDWKGVTPAEQIERLAKVPLAHQPGTVFEYGLSTDVLGRIVEVIADMPLSQFLQERVFVPLGMTDTAFIVPTSKRDRLAQPFATDPATKVQVDLLDVTTAQNNDAGGAGSVGTASDYARFLQMLMNG